MREPQGTPGTTPRQQPLSTPTEFAPRSTEHAIYTTLHEIQHEQGRHDERLSALLNATSTLTEKVEALTVRIGSLDQKVEGLGPKVEKWDDTYKKALGAIWACGLILVVVGGLLYWTNSSRLDKLLKILDSPGIEKVIKKEGK